MFKESYSKITSLALSLLVLVSGFTFSLEKQYCSNVKGEYATKVVSKCCVLKSNTVSSSAESDSCCIDVKASFDTQDFFKQFLEVFSPVFIPSNSTENFILSLSKGNWNTNQLFIYIPPESTIDFQITKQEFLI